MGCGLRDHLGCAPGSDRQEEGRLERDVESHSEYEGKKIVGGEDCIIRHIESIFHVHSL